MERKEFIKNFALGGSILLTAPVIFSSCSSDSDEDNEPVNLPTGNGVVIDLNATSSEALGTVGGYIYSGELIVFRTGENAYRAVAKACTHQNCPISYDHANGNLPCSCHGSKFTTAGTVINGPATTNLESFTVKLEGSTLKIT